MTDFTMEELELLEDGLYELFTIKDDDRDMCMKLDDIHNKIVKMRQELGSKKAVRPFIKDNMSKDKPKHPHRRRK